MSGGAGAERRGTSAGAEGSQEPPRTRRSGGSGRRHRGRRVWWWILGFLLMLALLGFTLPIVVGRILNTTYAREGAEGTPAPLSERAGALLATLSIADLHSDALLWSRDLAERGTWGHVDLPRLLEGRVAVQVFTTVTKTPRGMNLDANADDTDNITLLAFLQRWPRATWGSPAARALHQADKLRRLAADSDGRMRLIRTRADLDDFLTVHSTDPNTTAAILGIEGAHALEGNLDNVDRFFDAGFRMVGLTHFFDNAVGGSAHGIEQGGLTPFGAAVVARMEERGILVDLAHASSALIDDVLEIATRPVVVSHTGVRGTCDNRRNLDDDRLRAIAETGGVIGIGLWETAVCGTTPADWARAVRYTADLVGVEHVALGSDWDGAIPAIVDASGTAYLVQALLDQGLEESDIRSIMGENTIRVLRANLPDVRP